MFWMGIYPNTFLRKMDASLNHLLNTIKKQEVIRADISDKSRPVYVLDEGADRERAEEKEGREQ